MRTYPLKLQDGHLFTEVGDNVWLIDTGAPTSFGTPGNLTFVGERFTFDPSGFGLTATTLSEFVGVSCVGLLGADTLGRFDYIFDAASGRMTVAQEELDQAGQYVEFDEAMGIPIVTASIGNADYRMFFDTGAQFSYFQDDSLSEFPFLERVTDFHPSLGQFETGLHEVPAILGGILITLHCGKLPYSLDAALMTVGTKGIIGNEVLSNRVVGYFPRRRQLVLS